MKRHLVSLLWVEAVRKNHALVPEKDYPALGTDVFDGNLSNLCQVLFSFICCENIFGGIF